MEFKFDHKPMCLFCIRAKKIPYAEEMLCSKFGAVPKEHSCKKFKYNLMAREVRRKKDIDTSKFSAEDFSLD